jgi:hypothetical protein
MAQKKENKKKTRQKAKLKDLKPKKDPKGAAYNGNRQLGGGPRP